jgi:peptidoglycan/LPS O-acetylase OafA/YrhL
MLVEKTKAHHRRDIDGLRAIAVLSVVFCHAGLPRFTGGYIGVDIFFVISGFLITGILIRESEDGKFSIIRFYERRARRILPALFMLLAFFAISGFFFWPPWQYLDFVKSSTATIFFASNIWFLHTTGDYFGASAEYEPLLHTWSLAVEEQFYIVFPIIIWITTRWGRHAVVASILLLSSASFFLSVWSIYSSPLASFFLTPMRAWELGLGALVALEVFPQMQRRFAEIIAWIGVLMIFASIYFYSDDTVFPGPAAVLPCLGAAAIIWSGVQCKTSVAHILSTPIPVGFGLISYSLYLWHWPTLVIARGLVGSVHIGLVWATAVIAFSLLMAYLSWRYVERPFRKGPAMAGMGGAAVFSFTAAGASALLLTNGLIFLLDGFEGRISPSVRAVYEKAELVSEEEERCATEAADTSFCIFGSEKKGLAAEVLVWGDSHAGAMLPGFDLWAHNNNISGVAAVKNACAPIRGIERADQGTRHACAAFNERVLNYVAVHPNLTSIILIGRWALLAEGERAPGETGRNPVLAPASEEDEAPVGNLALFNYGLEATLKRLHALDRNVILVEGIPEFGFDVPKRYLESQFFGRSLSRGPSRAAFDKRNARALSVLERVSREYGTRRVSVADVMCQSACKAFANGNLLYRDDDHLSIDGANFVVQKIMN